MFSHAMFNGPPPQNHALPEYPNQLINDPPFTASMYFEDTDDDQPTLQITIRNSPPPPPLSALKLNFPM